jgi:antitoxin PrlF
LPKIVRQLLEVDTGSKLLFTLREGVVEVYRADEEDHKDEAIQRFLDLLADDISQGKHIGNLPDNLLHSLRSYAENSPVNVEHEEIEGEVSL